MKRSRWKKFLCAMLAVALVFSGCGFLEEFEDGPVMGGQGSGLSGAGSGAGNSTGSGAGNNTGSGTGSTQGNHLDGNAFGGSQKTGVTMSLEEDGALTLTRTGAGSVPMGPEGTWTVFVYLCGTDLESESGMASEDMWEMLEASTGEGVRFVVQTGGAKRWQEGGISTSKIERYEICNGSRKRVDSLKGASMGKGGTLADFLKWGVKNYPAARMGVVFWNHGGGSISGVCFDEKYDHDSLSLSEMNGALAEVAGDMTDKFEFIGFDACLMETVECANILASYARYMYGSEETEPGYGWDYTAIGDFLGKKPSVGGDELGKVVCDSFFEMCRLADEEAAATFSVIDLSRIDGVIKAFHDYAKNLYEATEDEAVLAEVVRRIKGADNYGGNNRSEGYTNMVDLAGIVNAGAKWVEGADEVLSAIRQAVIYMKNGSNHKAACGLATYYPLSVQGSTELKTFGEIAVSPYYLSLVDRCAYGLSNNGNTNTYDFSSLFSFWDFIWGGESGWDWNDTDNSWDLCGGSDYWDGYDYEVTGESPLVEFYDEPQLLEDGTFGFSLTDESLLFVASVQGVVYVVSDDEEDLIELGFTADIVSDWEYGIFTDNFDGYWFSLPDGQNLAVYLVEECDGYDIYTSPVLVNDRETNLRITHSYVGRDRIVIDGVWDGIDENGMAGRDVARLKRGDIITPLFYAYSMEYDGEEYTYYGDGYWYDGDPEIYFDLLYDGEYLYGFRIDDIYGDYYITDFVDFEIEDGEVYYFED